MKFSDRLTTKIVLFRLLNCNRTNRRVIYVAEIDVGLLTFHKLKTKFGKFEHKIHIKKCIKVNIYLAFVQL